MSDNTFTPEEARDRILQLLDIYPAVSLSMVNISMNWLDTKVWRPVLDQMLEEGVLKTKSLYMSIPGRRNQAREVIYNPKRFDYPAFAEQVANVQRVTVDLTHVDAVVEEEVLKPEDEFDSEL